MTTQFADTIFRNGKITTLDDVKKEATAIAVLGDRIIRVGTDQEVMALRGPSTLEVDLKGRRVTPGLIDSHLHLIRGGLNYNMELRWDGVPSLALAMEMLKKQVAITPPPQWVRVVGGFTEHQFQEKRLPTLQELNAVAPDTPIFILHLYDRALLNGAALRACGYDKNTPDFPGGYIERDSAGNPTGLLIAKPSAALLYASLAKGPKLPFEYQLNSTQHFMRELNRLGVTGAIDAGGGSQNYPEDYQVIEKLASENKLTVRIAYNLFTQKPKGELADFERWTQMVKLGQGDHYYHHNGAGEMLVYSAADFEDFREPRPDMPGSMEADLESVVRLLSEKRWPFRIHATYDETIGRALNVFEKVNRDIPFNGLHWFIDHAETIQTKNIERIKALGGGIAIQHRMAYQGEYFVQRYGAYAAKLSPPIRQMLSMDLPVGGGTDATRVASYNPWICLYWLVTGKTVGGMRMYDQANLLEREEALRRWTVANTWFSNEEGVRGQLMEGQLADFIVLSDDFFAVDSEKIKDISSVLTVVGGKPVHAESEFSKLNPPMPDAMPDWSPIRTFGGYQKSTQEGLAAREITHIHHLGCDHSPLSEWDLGCGCWAF